MMDAKTFTEAMYLAKTLFGEARGEGRGAMRLVGWVIRNRVEDPKRRWPRSYAGVVTQPLQFSCWNKNDPNRAKISDPMSLGAADQLAWMAAVEEALRVLTASPDANPIPGVYWYHDHSIQPPAWAKRLVAVAVPEAPKFTFYREGGEPA